MLLLKKIFYTFLFIQFIFMESETRPTSFYSTQKQRKLSHVERAQCIKFTGDCCPKTNLESTKRDGRDRGYGYTQGGPPRYKLARTRARVTSDVFAGFTTVCSYNDSFRQFDLQIAFALNQRLSLPDSVETTNPFFRPIDRHRILCKIRREPFFLQNSTRCTCSAETLNFQREAQAELERQLQKVCCCHVM